MALLGGILGGDHQAPTPVQNAGILPFPPISFPFSIPGLPTLSFPTIGLPPHSTSESSASASLSASSSAPVSTSSAPPSTSSAPLTTPSDSSTTPTTSALPSTTNNVPTQTATNVVVVSGDTSPSASSEPSHHQSFLENKPLSGTVFGLVGLVALVVIVIIATWFVRRRRRSRLLDDALSFDPALLGAADRMDASEKGQGHASNPSFGTTNGGAAGGYSTYSGYTGSAQQHSELYGAQDYYTQQAQPVADYGAAWQPSYGYAPPMAETANSSWGQQQSVAAPPAPVQQHNIPRVPVPPQPAPLPEEFGSDEAAERRRSAEETEFWARTLKVVNE